MRIIFDGFVYGFACIGLVSLGTTVLIKYHITDVPGVVDPNTGMYESNEIKNFYQNKEVSVDTPGKNKITFDTITAQLEQLTAIRSALMQRYCRVKVISTFFGSNAQAMIDEYTLHYSDTTLDKMLVAVDVRLKSNQEYVHQKELCGNVHENATIASIASYVGTPRNSNNIFPWGNDEIWETLKTAVVKDRNDILKASQQADIDPRMLVAVMFVEQNRVYRTEREFVKSVLLPFSLLSTGSNASLGTMNIKPQTAKKIEENLNDQNSNYYPGDAYAHLLDFSTDNHDQERIKRLTDYKNRYYSYLYGALYLKEYEKQWELAGFPIEGRPEILGTLFNIGFKHSVPNASPKVGGSIIDIKGVHYTFGSLAYEFYYSGILAKEFSIRSYDDKK